MGCFGFTSVNATIRLDVPAGDDFRWSAALQPALEAPWFFAARAEAPRYPRCPRGVWLRLLS